MFWKKNNNKCKCGNDAMHHYCWYCWHMEIDSHKPDIDDAIKKMLQLYIAYEPNHDAARKIDEIIEILRD